MAEQADDSELQQLDEDMRDVLSGLKEEDDQDEVEDGAIAEPVADKKKGGWLRGTSNVAKKGSHR
jgi:hypothetical protein